MKRNVVILFVILSSLSMTVFFAVHQTASAQSASKAEVDALQAKIAEKQAAIKELEQSIENYKKKINQKKLEKVSLNNQIAILDNRKTQVELDIEITRQKLDTVNLEIDRLNLLISEKEESIDRQKGILSELVRVLHYEGSKKYIEVLAAYDHFSDFYARLQYLEKLQEDLGAQAKELRLAKADLEEKQHEADERKTIFEKLELQLNEKQRDLKEQQTAKASLLSQTQASERTYQTLVNNLRAQYQEIENEISAIEREIRQRLTANNQLDGLSDDAAVLSWPTNSRYITARFRDPTYPYRYVFEHSAIDIRAAQGTPVKAAASGYVGRAKICSSAACYAYVMIIHSGGISTVYGHLSSISVQQEQFVARGDVIGYSGARPGTVGAGPFTTGPHLHFEVRKNGIPVDPLGYLVKDY